MRKLPLAALLLLPALLTWKAYSYRSRVKELEANQNDYAGQSRFIDAPAQGQIVCIGDSVTARWRDAPCINRGVRAETTSQMLLRFRRDVLSLKPSIVIIEGGTNDIFYHVSPGTTEGNIRSMCEIALVNNVRCVVASLLPTSQALGSERPPGQIKEMNDRLRDYCTSRNLTFVDYYSAMNTDGFLCSDLSDDGLHPNERGYKVMRDVLMGALG